LGLIRLGNARHGYSIPSQVILGGVENVQGVTEKNKRFLLYILKNNDALANVSQRVCLGIISNPDLT
jgi:hypothetical protein